jgi:UDP-N-acetylmuramyl pentapeptide phosphotransferase/UDP-N-acetylglucosamine-1-phosphate transferase
MLLTPAIAVPIVVGAFASFLFALTLVFTTHRYGKFALDLPGSIQGVHSTPTPRIGGVGIFSAAVLARISSEDAAVRGMLDTILLAGAPALLAGLAEDMTRKVAVKARLGATLLSGALACLVSGFAITRVDFPFIDTVLLWPGVAVAFTMFAIAGVTNAINIIDGFNGLASGTTAISLAGIAAVAFAAGDPALAGVSMTLAALMVGFWAVNFPWGKLFLGDGGAYFAGFALACVAVQLPTRNPGVSPWASLLICAYPVIEVLYSVMRRWGSRQPTTNADRGHLHSLIATRVVRHKLAAFPAPLQNSAVSVVMWAFAALPVVVGVALYSRTDGLVAGAAGALLLYHWLYRRVARR